MAAVTNEDAESKPTSLPTLRHAAIINPETGYITNINTIRDTEYPQLKETTYLDHAGTTIYAKSLIENYSRELCTNLFGNPHSASASSQLSSRRIDDARLRVLRFFNADPDEFDVVFVANATAAIKLVADAFRDLDSGFRYFYHSEAHTSLVGVRELAARDATCFASDLEVEKWLDNVADGGSTDDDGKIPSLFGYPAQSNMTGRRLPLEWTRRVASIRKSSRQYLFTLLDAAALVSTSPLDLSDPSTSPDFTTMSFYKIFGFPDLGALIVRKSCRDFLRRRKYFGGGTVEAVAAVGKETWHAKKASLHSSLEDGTVPFHSIVALHIALDVHKELYGTMENVSRHANYLTAIVRERLSALRHANGSRVCTVYNQRASQSSGPGPVVAFNLKDNQGNYISNSEVEKLATVRNIQFRTGGLCNPGGIATHLGLSADDLQQNFDRGQRCGGDVDIISGTPTGAIRLSFGAMSSRKDADTFVKFIEEFYVDSTPARPGRPDSSPTSTTFVIESLSVFPIKSCAAYKVPTGIAWEVGAKGLAWDREWCLVHQGTNVALSQKRFPRMALLRPEVHLEERILKVFFPSSTAPNPEMLEISLACKPTRSGSIQTCETASSKSANVCGDDIDVQIYTSPKVAEFFTAALEVPCTLARFPPNGMVRQAKVRVLGKHHGRQATKIGRSISLSNESPILLVSRSSVNHLNEQIKQNGSGVGKAVTADSFRGNIVVAEELCGGQKETPYAEDDWSLLRIGQDPQSVFELLGPCQRCQMVCVDQRSAQRRQEPFSTLAKTRRRDGRVWFGMHMCLASGEDPTPMQDPSCSQSVSVKVGDGVTPLATVVLGS